MVLIRARRKMTVRLARFPFGVQVKSGSCATSNYCSVVIDCFVLLFSRGVGTTAAAPWTLDTAAFDGKVQEVADVAGVSARASVM